MFWKNANLSIAQRLTLLYASASLGILLIISFALYESLEHNLIRELKSQLWGQFQVISGLVKKHPFSHEILGQEIITEPLLTEDMTNRSLSRVIRANKSLLIETPGMETILPFTPNTVDLNQIQKSPKGIFSHITYDGQTFLVLTRVFDLPNHHHAYLQIVKSMEIQKRLLQQYRRMIIWMLILGALLSVLLGIGLAKRSMTPLTKITKRVKTLSTDQLHQRLDESQWPDELMALATAFNSMCDRLEKSFNRLKQFSEDLAHELRTPIHNLIGEIEITLSQSRHTREYQKVLRSNLEECQRLSQIVSGLLFLAQTNSPETKLHKKFVEAREIIDTACDFYAAFAEEKSIQLTCEGRAIFALDEALFRRVIHNLLANAIKYTPENGFIAFGISQNKHETTITITDTGSGIDPEELPFIFDRFYRTDKARSHGSGGLGLGLAITKSIVNLHGASITIESKLHQGTTVTLFFPNQ